MIVADKFSSQLAFYFGAVDVLGSELVGVIPS